MGEELSIENQETICTIRITYFLRSARAFRAEEWRQSDLFSLTCDRFRRNSEGAHHRRVQTSERGAPFASDKDEKGANLDGSIGRFRTSRREVDRPFAEPAQSSAHTLYRDREPRLYHVSGEI